MMRLTPLQWTVLAIPPALLLTGLVGAAAWQLHNWHLTWLWPCFFLGFWGWRWLLVRWTQPTAVERSPVADLLPLESDRDAQARDLLQRVLAASRTDRPFWEDWPGFWQRCLELVQGVARIYHPEVEYPLLNIQVLQAYRLVRDTVDDLDRWLQNYGPLLDRLTIAQAYQAYRWSLKAAPWLKRAQQVWEAAQWLLHPAWAIAREATREASDRTNQALFANLGQQMREAALENLWQRSLELYRGQPLPTAIAAPESVLSASLLDQVQQWQADTQAVESAPLRFLLIGRTGAGKSSLINALFQTETATVDCLPSTPEIQTYDWQLESGDRLQLLDSPGYEQAGRSDLWEQVLAAATTTDAVVLLTPATDPALASDRRCLQDLQSRRPDLPLLVGMTHSDRLRPWAEWQPPYDWQQGDRPKEIAIREAVAYRQTALADFTECVLPLANANGSRPSWNLEAITAALLQHCPEASQIRLAAHLRDRQLRADLITATIQRHQQHLQRQQDLTGALKRPVLGLLAQLLQQDPRVGIFLADRLPLEDLPQVIAELQLASELLPLLSGDRPLTLTSELGTIWPLLNQQRGDLQTFSAALLAHYQSATSLVGSLNLKPIDH
ncbi:GTPase family protein [Synechococcus elongatus]|uniref:GTPase n=1 Tax=Synechococcus elongatus PCC 11802 TaxID=2283154 RepID=A0AAT9JT26_SYNEL